MRINFGSYVYYSSADVKFHELHWIITLSYKYLEKISTNRHYHVLWVNNELVIALKQILTFILFHLFPKVTIPTSTTININKLNGLHLEQYSDGSPKTYCNEIETKDLETTSIASSTNFTIINDETSNQKNKNKQLCTRGRQVSIVVFCMTILLLVSVLACIYAMESKYHIFRLYLYRV